MTVDLRQRDRLESLKAGLVGASAIIPTEMMLLGLMGLQRSWQGFALFSAFHLVLPASLSLWAVLFHLSETALSGFLFGVTYRYAIRQDTNPQLKTGTILAFALARSLGQADVGWQLESHWGQWIGWVGESFGLFAIAALLLNRTIQKGWILPASNQERDPDGSSASS